MIRTRIKRFFIFRTICKRILKFFGYYEIFSWFSILTAPILKFCINLNNFRNKKVDFQFFNFCQTFFVLFLIGCSIPYSEFSSYEISSFSPRESGFLSGKIYGERGKILKFSLKDCISQALKNHRGLRIAKRKILIAKDKVIEGWGIQIPKIQIEAQYEARNNDLGFSFQGMKITTSEREIGTARVSLLVPIYDFGYSEGYRDLGRAQAKMAAKNTEKVRQDLVLAVTQAYFRILEAQKIEKVVKESIQVIQNQRNIVQDFLEQGLVAKNDLLTIDVQLAERQQQWMQAANNVRLAFATLKHLMGINIDTKLKIEDVLEAPLWKGSFQDALSSAIKNRPDLQLYRHRIEMAQANCRITRSGFAPRISAFAHYNYTTDDSLLNQDWLSGGVGIQFPLFDGGVTYARFRQCKKKVEEAVDLYKQHIDDIALEVKKAYLHLINTRERIPVAKKAIELAQENLRIVQDRYTQGLVTSTDVLTEEDRLAHARSHYYQTLYEYHQAFALLTNVVGKELSTHEGRKM